ncbi:MAG TPA: trypsin-like peptidase domain-containing protein [Pyrinomonadaceae bacterium]|nr:trypsin-like peptidase domain-containing protein [Pyrinomonadaceae bacterium]
MLEIPKGQTTDADRDILRRLRVWIVAMAVACLVVGIGIGALLTGKQVVAQNEAQKAAVARAPEALSASFAEIARRVEPAVVNIDTVAAAPQIAGRRTDSDEDEEEQGEGPSENPILEMFRRRQPTPQRGVGSGVIVDPKGLILTNKHVIEGASKIMVKLQSGDLLRGQIVGVDDETDLAVVQVKAGRDLPFAKLGNSDDAQVGDWVLAIGSPFGLAQTVTAGIISTRERADTPQSSAFQRFLQTDAAINRGNSGGPLVNMRGEVIGINSQIATTTGDYNGIGFALPANEAGFVYRQLVADGKVRRGYIGIYPVPVRAEYARVYGLPEAKGAIVRDIPNVNSPAVKAGLEVNDIIIAVDNQQIVNEKDLISKVAAIPVGQTAQLTFLREVNGKFERRTANVVIGERPAPDSLRPQLPGEERERAESLKNKNTAASDRPTLGLTLSELTPQIANDENLKGVRGLWVKDVDPGGLAFDAGILRGMVVTRVNRTPVTTLAEFEKVINGLKPGDAVVMNVTSNANNRLNQIIVQFTYQ